MIIRSKRTQRYTVIPNSLIEDKLLDWKELGLLVYLLSKPDDWSVSVSQLVKVKKTGEDAIRGMLKKLRAADYIIMKKRGSGEVDYLVFDTPQTGKNPNRENPDKAIPTSGKTQTGKNPNRENPALIITEYIYITNTEVIPNSSTHHAMTIADLLAQKIFEYNEKAKIKPDSWIGDIEKAVRIDERTLEELKSVIVWIYSPEGKFWIPNIMSGKKLRDQYDRIFAQMQSGGLHATHQRTDKQSSYLEELNRI